MLEGSPTEHLRTGSSGCDIDTASREAMIASTPAIVTNSSESKYNSHGTGGTSPVRVRGDGSKCSICRRLDLQRMFLREHSEISLGSLKEFLAHSCSFADVVRVALRCQNGPFCASDSFDPEAAENPDLLLKSRGWLSAETSGGRLNMHIAPTREWRDPRVILAMSKQPAGMMPGWTSTSAKVKPATPYIIAELEPVQEGSDHCPEADRPWRSPLRRPVKGHFDCQLARKWLDICRDHTAINKWSDTTDMSLWQDYGFRLIDVHNQCLVQRVKPCEYVALSYVWGDAMELSLCAKVSNIGALYTTGSLATSDTAEEDGRRACRTISDAMIATEKLGFRYLWVDALCIVQDDFEEKQRLINGMNNIYQGATLTLMDAAGTDADSGLQGISPRPSLPYDVDFEISQTDHPACKVAISRPSWVDEVRRSRWNSRSWTLQEACLSHRCLWFTPYEVFFSCESCHFREGYAFEGQTGLDNKVTPRTGPPWWSSSVQADLDPSPHRCLVSTGFTPDWQTYQYLVCEYSRRSLGHRQDIVNAFRGICNRFEYPSLAQLPYPDGQGIPLSFLSEGLLWYPLEGCVKHMSRPGRKNLQQAFSSWSWVSWSGPVNFLCLRLSAFLGEELPASAFWNKQDLLLSDLHVPIETDGIPVGVSRDSAMNQLCISFWSSKYELSGIVAANNAVSLSHQQLSLMRRGVISFYAPVYTGSFSLSLLGGSIWNIEISGVGRTGAYKHRAGSYTGVFRFDDSTAELRVERLVAVMSWPGIEAVLGLVAAEDGVFTRVGIGILTWKADRSGDAYMEKGYRADGLFREDENLRTDAVPWEVRHIDLR